MGFLDKARQMAEQAQAKLDETQRTRNDARGSGARSDDPPAQYDDHGRPIPTAPPADATPPHGDPLAPDPGVPPVAVPPVPPKPAEPPADRVAVSAEPTRRDEPPRMSSGDPLAG